MDHITKEISKLTVNVETELKPSEINEEEFVIRSNILKKDDTASQNNVDPEATEINEDDDEFFLGKIVYPVREKPIVNKANPWGNITFDDSDLENQDISNTDKTSVKEGTDDFLTECYNLQKKILGTSVETVKRSVLSTAEENSNLSEKDTVQDSSKDQEESTEDTSDSDKILKILESSDETVKQSITPIEKDNSNLSEKDLTQYTSKDQEKNTENASVSNEVLHIIESLEESVKQSVSSTIQENSNLLEKNHGNANDKEKSTEDSSDTEKITSEKGIDDFATECFKLQQKILESAEDIAKQSDKLIGQENSNLLECNLVQSIQKQKEEKNISQEGTEKKEILSVIKTVDNNIKELENEKKCVSPKNEEHFPTTKKYSEEYVFDLTLDVNEQKDYLLASVCRSGNICIWRGGTDGHLELLLPKHVKPSFNKKKRDNRQNWISLCWVQPTLLLTSSIWHELLMWDLIPKPNKAMKYQIKSSLIHADHKKHIFAIAVPYALYEKPENENWRNNKELCVWTTSQDRWLLCTNLSTRCNVACYSTFGGNITCMSVSQLDPNKISFAVGDGTIRIWDLSRPHKQNILMSSFSEKVHGKASSLDWHPTKESCLAFATSEGRIGEYDLNNRNKLATVYSNYHRGTVYKIQWGPLPNDAEKYGLYSCSLGELTVHDATKPNKEPYQLTIFEEENVTTFTWKVDYSALAVGSKNGTVKILDQKFNVLQTLYMHKKSIRCLEWHPLATASDNGLSEYCNYLAVSNKECEIYVYDCSNQSADEEDRKNHIVLSGNTSGVTCMSWCPQISGRLVSSCEDGVLIVWDIKTQNMLSVFNSACDTNSTVVWSPLDADLIILGGKILQIWRITENPPVLPKVSKKQEAKQKKVIKIAAANTEKNDGSEKEMISSNKDEKGKKKVILPLVSRALSSTESTIKSCRKMFENLNNDNKMNIGESDDEVSDSEEFEDAKEFNDSNMEVSIEPHDLFSTRKEIFTLLNHERKLCFLIFRQ